MDKSRKDFEAWVRQVCITAPPDAAYDLGKDAWLASRKQALQEAYDAMLDIKGDKVTRFNAQTAIRALGTPPTAATA